VRVGGFYRVPRRRELAPLAEALERARDIARETVRWTAKLDFPALERDYEFVSLRHPDEYPFNEGRIVSSRGIDISPADYAQHFEEVHVERSTALQSRIVGRGAYLTGPLARYSLNHDRLPPAVREAAKAAGLGATCTNPYRSIVVRAVETLYACEEALRIIAGYQEPDRPAVAVEPRAGIGCAATEAPRGMLWHRYSFDARGLVKDARIVPPTAQNLRSMEEDLHAFAATRVDLDDAALKWGCEQAVRNHDPCISCATHFLRVNVDRS